MLRHFTSEAVSVGHPDRMCDIVVDAITAEIVKQDPYARVALEALTKTGMIVLAGEITTSANVDYEGITRRKIREIGYIDHQMGFDADTCAVMLAIGKQSPEIAQGVDRGTPLTQGAGDQGIMFGYATDEYDPTFTNYMPLPLVLADKLVQAQREARYKGGAVASLLWPDAKAQVTLAWDDSKADTQTSAFTVDTVLMSSQHAPELEWNALHDYLVHEIFHKVIPENLLTTDTKYLVNPTGRFVIGGPCGDAGVVGRKLAYNNYGGAARIGGGNFHGKDMSKVDRSGAYMCRYVAKNLVAAGLAHKCEIQVSYAIGKAEPLSLFIETFGTEQIPLPLIYKTIEQFFDFRPGVIISDLNLLRYDVEHLWGGCHFHGDWSADATPPWEQLNKVNEIRAWLPPTAFEKNLPALKKAS